MQAQMMIERQQPEEALAILNRLDKKLSNHPQVLKLLKQVHLSVNDWEEPAALNSPVGGAKANHAARTRAVGV
ncbi:hypothetical protein HSBAA_64870 [Vreelandella sulfidaeris]|uniref:Uncharacterized protein n=1 Tax=Vreelandella sulfidaeris TaxID=115553 RepID=A0A455UKF2_9GAMM|nr:hypothetical protein HSBAA_64870 [Halomonas sulfidaeris]